MNKELIQIRAKLGHVAMKWRPSLWLDTGIPRLNRVAGHVTRGIAYGRMIEISGWEGAAKSATALSLAALAQRDGAHVIIGDLENSFEPDWALQRGLLKCPKCAAKDPARTACAACEGSGLDTNMLTLIQPYVGKFASERKDKDLTEFLRTYRKVKEFLSLDLSE